MAQTCPHGFAPSDCLICEALGKRGTQTATASGRRGRTASARSQPVVPSQVMRPGERRTKRSGGTSLALIAVGLIIAVIAAVALAGVVFTILRIFELIVVAAAAGWVGYHIGHFRGARGH